MRVTPMCSQRRAPLLTSPNSATPTSSPTPTTYTGSASRAMCCGGMFAAIHMTVTATPMLSSCPPTREKFCPDAL